MFSLDSAISSDSFVRIVDAFVDTIDLKSFGFAHVECQEEGRPPYHPSVLLKLYLYGYHHGIRTTRKLEREAQTNIECMWLLTGLRPKYKTIADFRKNHSKAFREVFRRFVCLLKEWNLIEGETVAIDSFKIRGNNSLKNNFNEKKLKRHLEYIDAQISEYERMLDACDMEQEKEELKKKIEERKQKQSKYKQVQEDLKASAEDQISLTDPDSRMENGIIIATAGEKGRVPFVFSVILLLHAKAAKAGIYVQRVKRQRGFTHTNVRGKEKVLGEVGILFIGYNLTRCVSILGMAELIKALRKCCLLILTRIKWLILSPYNEFSFSGIKMAAW